MQQKIFFQSLYSFLKQQLFFFANQGWSRVLALLVSFHIDPGKETDLKNPLVQKQRWKDDPLVVMVWTVDFVPMGISVCGPALKFHLRECTLLMVVRAMRITSHLCLPHSLTWLILWLLILWFDPRLNTTMFSSASCFPQKKGTFFGLSKNTRHIPSCLDLLAPKLSRN